jgi:hypothetical protein
MEQPYPPLIASSLASNVHLTIVSQIERFIYQPHLTTRAGALKGQISHYSVNRTGSGACWTETADGVTLPVF